MPTNPYQSPHPDAPQAALNEAPDERVPHLGLLSFSFLVTAAVALDAAVAIPFALLGVPAIIRTRQIRYLRATQGVPLDSMQHVGLICRSLIAAIPVGVASAVVFGLVAGLAAWASVELARSIRLPPLLCDIVNLFGVFAGSYLSLLIGRKLLRRWQYLSFEIIRARYLESK